MSSYKVKNDKKILGLLSEAGLLKRVKRSGWWVAGIKNPESVADHCFRCAVIGYLLANLENVDRYKVTLMCLFNDIHEARINDAHKVASRYLNYIQAEQAAFNDQIKDLPPGINKELKNLRNNYVDQKSKESIVARDADILECLLQAREYYDHGYKHAKLFFKKAPRFLKTKSAKSLWKQIKTMDSSRWWRTITEFKR